MSCYCVPTPYSIQNRDTDPYDIFQRIIPDTDEYAAEKRLALWDRFHDTGLGNDNETYWIRCLEAAKSVDLSDGQIKSKSVSSVYDPPEVKTVHEADQYLADQNKTEFEQQTYGGLESETVRQYADAIVNPFETWAAEFDKLFYWGI
ncbi:hypothetical protein [Megasphaera sp.]|uniref:hypothetical protein n=1 Tax=Megasphaera sp. TaxID=2023260 RepID=UPI002579F195|nr:hypothetical protein [Megasphaera sp.]